MRGRSLDGGRMVNDVADFQEVILHVDINSLTLNL